MQRKQRPKAARITPGTFAHVIREFQKSPHYLQSITASTRAQYARVLRIAEAHEGLGGLTVDIIRPSLVQIFLDALADKPGQQRNARTALKSLEKWALVRDKLPFPIMTGTYCVSSDGGHEPWTFPQVELAEKHAREDLARTVTLMVHTGQRGSDVVRMNPTDLETKSGRLGIHVRQQKTGKRLWVPFTAELESVMQKWPRRPGPFVLRPSGEPYTRPLLSWHWNNERDANEALKPLKDAGLVLHGLRATAVVRARKAGATDLQIANMFGMSEPMVARYSRLEDQTEMALAAVHFLDRTAQERHAANELKKQVLSN